MLRQNWDLIRQRIRAAALRAGRDPAQITLVGVTKTVAAETIWQAIDLGLADIGENRVQEAQAKRREIDAWLKAQGSGLRAIARSPEHPAKNNVRIRWHLIGRLQSNKAKRAVDIFDCIQSVDSLEIIGRLTRHAEAAGRKVAVLLQVNVSGEPTKGGCAPQQALTLADAVRRSAHLELSGLMTLAPYSPDAQSARPHFSALRQLRERLKDASLKLSMGMSQDFEVAIEEGADIVRIGTALFGERHSVTE